VIWNPETHTSRFFRFLSNWMSAEHSICDVKLCLPLDSDQDVSVSSRSWVSSHMLHRTVGAVLCITRVCSFGAVTLARAMIWGRYPEDSLWGAGRGLKCASRARDLRVVKPGKGLSVFFTSMRSRLPLIRRK